MRTATPTLFAPWECDGLAVLPGLDERQPDAAPVLTSTPDEVKATMTLAQVKAMFKPGQRWRAIRAGSWKDVDEERGIRLVTGKDIVFVTPDGKDCWTPFPKQREIREARPDFLHFVYEARTGANVTLQRLDAEGGAA